jgi:hypothetical protein
MIHNCEWVDMLTGCDYQYNPEPIGNKTPCIEIGGIILLKN